MTPRGASPRKTSEPILEFASFTCLMEKIPLIASEPLFCLNEPHRKKNDAFIMREAARMGFLILTDLPESICIQQKTRDALLRFFDLSETLKLRLSRRSTVPNNTNRYRGYFPLSSGIIKEGMDIGPVAPVLSTPGDALTESTPYPEDSELPGWGVLSRQIHSRLEIVGAALMRALARGLGLEENIFTPAFKGGISTLRILRYPPWPRLAELYRLPLKPIAPDRFNIGGEHVDSGFVTLLQQDGVEGLQAQSKDGVWIDVPHLENSLVVNFGQLLQRWSGGRIRATTHRVLGQDRTRHSIPFFYEPRVDSRISPLPFRNGPQFEPFFYGDHLWQTISAFPEFQATERFTNFSDHRIRNEAH